jgi:hypothetical protein
MVVLQAALRGTVTANIEYRLEDGLVVWRVRIRLSRILDVLVVLRHLAPRIRRVNVGKRRRG